MVEKHWGFRHQYFDRYHDKTDITSLIGPYIYQNMWSWVDLVPEEDPQDGFPMYFQMRWLNPPDIMESFYAELDRREGAITEERYDEICEGHYNAQAQRFENGF